MKMDDIWKNEPVGDRKKARERRVRSLEHQYQISITKLMHMYRKFEQEGKVNTSPFYAGDFESILITTPSNIRALPQEFYIRNDETFTEEAKKIKSYFEQTFKKLKIILHTKFDVT